MEVLISEKGRPKDLGEKGNNRDIYCYATWECQFLKKILTSTPGIKIFIISWFSYIPDQILGG